MSKFVFDRTPVLLPVEMKPEERIGRCPVCGKAVYEEDRVVMLDSGAMIHEGCAVFRQESLMEFLDLLGVDYYTGTAKEMAEDG